MFKKLKIRFILITMLSVIGVLFVMMSTINAINYIKLTSYSDNLLDILIDSGGEFDISDFDFEDNKNEILSSNQTSIDIENEEETPPKDNFNKETPYETRFFSIKYIGEKVFVNTKNIAAISEEEAINLADDVIKNGNKKGYRGNYKYKISNENDLIVFIDCSRQIKTAKNFLKSSTIVFLITITAIFILIFLLSNKVIAHLVRNYEKQKNFITDASHELKTPLTIISAHNEILEIELGENESTLAIAKQVERLTLTVKNLTALTKLDEIEKFENSSEFVFSNILNETIKIFSNQFESKNKKIISNIEKNILFYGDETFIRQLLCILLDNASKYSLTKVEINAYKSNKNTILLISNDAEYIKLGDMHECLQRFYRSDYVRASSIEGSGIGLSIAHEIVQLHNGTINVFGSSPNIFNIKIIF